jgi:hypothetical protein
MPEALGALAIHDVMQHAKRHGNKEPSLLLSKKKASEGGLGLKSTLSVPQR